MKSLFDSIKGRTKDHRGFTLIEILIALALTAIVTTAIYSLYIMFMQRSACQDLKLESQQKSRAAIELIQRELFLTGLRVPDGVDPVTGFGADSFGIRYWDPVSNERLVVFYRLTDDVLEKHRCLAPPGWACSPGAYSTVIDNVSSLSVEYRDVDGNATTLASEVRSMKVSITVESSGVCTERTPPSVVTSSVSVEVWFRNLDVTGTSADTIPPPVPTGLEVREATTATREGICGRLVLRWDVPASPDIDDIAYYTVYYALGENQGFVTVQVDDLTDVGGLGSKYEYTLAPGTDAATGNWRILHTPSYQSDPSEINDYAISIRAFDDARNPSDPVEVQAGNTAFVDRNVNFGLADDDTTVSPSRPDPFNIGDFIGVDGSNEGEVELSWSYPAGYFTDNPDVTHVRIYRSDTPITLSTDAPLPNSLAIYDAPISDTSYTDNDATLIGCNMYHYAIAPLNCDATLISSDTGDNEFMVYDSSYYEETYGDGDGPEGDLPGSADTSPPDITGIGEGQVDYPYPTLEANAGWKRVHLGLYNPKIAGTAPLDPDFSHSYVAFRKYSSAESCDPDCYPGTISSDGMVTDGTLVPDFYVTDGSGDEDGKFTQPVVPDGDPAITNYHSFFFDSEGQVTPGPPELDNVCPYGAEPDAACTYYFKAISYDLCGNKSQITAFSQPLSTLCGDDPDFPGSPGPVSGLIVEGCTDAWVSWDGNLETDVYDFAGYVVYRDTDTNFPNGATILTGTSNYAEAGVTGYEDIYWPAHASCLWGCGRPWYEDTVTSANDGSTFYYHVRTMDCAYASDPLGNTLPAPPALPDVDYIDYPNNISSATTSVIPFRPGRIDRDVKCEDTDGSVNLVCGNSDLNDTHREVLTGVSMNSDGSATPDSDLAHDSITIFLNNTSAGAMTVMGVDLDWTNTAAELDSVAIGGGRSSYGVVTTNVGGASSAGSGVYDKSMTGVLINGGVGVEVAGLDRYVPITFGFVDSGGGVLDMRNQEIRMTLTVMNNSTGTASCISYLTVAGAFSGINTVDGPVVSSVQQDQPGAGTNSGTDSALTGSYLVNALEAVTVSAIASGQTTHADTGAPVPATSMKMYYTTTSTSVTTAPTSGYTEVATQVGGSSCDGGSCAFEIPATDGDTDTRVWFYFVAQDEDGNFVRGPEFADGAYVYDQKAFDPCDFTPSVPANMGLVSDGATDVDLTWDDVITYDSGLDVYAGTTPDVIRYHVFRKEVIDVLEDFPQLGAGGCAGDVGTGSCTETTLDIPNNDYQYYVKALNSCLSANMYSAKTDYVKECDGSSNPVVNISVATINSNDSYDITIQSCAHAWDGTSGDTFYNVNITTLSGLDADIISLTETNDTGVFTTTVDSNVIDTGTDLDSEILTSTNGDTITVTLGDYGGSTPDTVDVTFDACDNVPGSPTIPLLNNAEPTDRKQGPPGDNDLVYLSWTTPEFNTDGSSVRADDIMETWMYREFSADKGTSWVQEVDGGGVPIVAATFSTTSPDTTILPLVESISEGGQALGTWLRYKATTIDACSNESPYSTASSALVAGSCIDPPDTPAALVYAHTDSEGNPTPLDVDLAGDVLLTWDDIDDSTYNDLSVYKIYRSDNAGAYAQVGTSPINSYTDSTTAVGNEYQYLVTSFDVCSMESGQSGSTTSILNGSCDLPPAEPTTLAYTYTDGGGNTPPLGDELGVVQLGWVAPADTDGINYTVYGWTDLSGTWLPVPALDVNFTTATTADVDVSLVPAGTEMQFEVSSVDFCGLESAIRTNSSTTIVKATCDFLPTAPTVLTYNYTDEGGNTAPPLGDLLDEVLLSWTAPATADDVDITSYTVFASVGGFPLAAVPPAEVTFTTATTATIDVSGKAADTDLYYTVSATDYCLQNGPQSGATSTIKKDVCDAIPDAPTGVVYNYTDAGGNTAPPLGDLAGAVTLDWTASVSTDTASYTVYGSNDGGATWTSLATGITTTAGNVVPTTAFAAGDDLVFSVSTVDNCGREGAKSALTATSVERGICDSLPDAPTGVVYNYTDAGGNTAPPLGDLADAVTLDWTASIAADTATYSVYGSDDNGVSWTSIATGITTITGNSVPTTAFVTGDALVFAASTIDTCNREGAKSAQTGTSVEKDSCDALPASPTGVVYNYTDAGGNSAPPLGDLADAVTLDWTASAATDTATYTVYGSDDGGGSWTSIATGITTITGNSVPTTAFVTGDDLVFAASTVDTCLREGTKSAPTATSVEKDSCDALPTAPTGVVYNYTDAGGNSAPPLGDLADAVTLDWTASAATDTATYTVYGSDDGGGSWTSIATGITTITGNSVPTTAFVTGDDLVFSAATVDSCNREGAKSAQTATSVEKDSCDALPASPTGVVYNYTDAGGNSAPPLGDLADAVTLDWTASAATDTATYTVYGSDDGGGSWTSIATGITTITGNSVPTTAFVTGDDLVFAASTVDTCLREGTKSAPTATSVEKDSCDALPTAPTGVVYNYTDAGGNSAPPLGDSAANTVTLDWTASAAADTASYTVYGSDDGGGSWTSIATGITTITGNSVPTTAFVTGDDLVFSAATVDSCNREGAKSAQTATSVEKDSCDALPASPTGVVYNYTDAGGNSAPPLGDLADAVTLDWTASAATDTATYTVYASDDNGGSWTSIATGITTITGNSVPTTAFVAGDDLVFATSTVDSCNREGAKSAQTATSVEKDSCDALPAAPTGVVYDYTDAGGNTAPPLGDLADAVTLDWTASAASDVASYTVYGSDDGGGSWTSIATGITTTQDNSVPTTAFVTGDDLVFSAATVDSCNREGAKSAQTATSVEKDSCDALPASPTGVVYNYTDAGGNSAPPLGDLADAVTLDWTASAATDTATYTVYASDDNGGSWTSIATGITTITGNSVPTTAFVAGDDLVFSAATVDSCNREGTKSAQTATSVEKDSCDALPAAPTGVVYNYTDAGGNSAPPLGDSAANTVTLDWTASAAIDTASYTVYASDDNGGSWTSIATGITTITGNAVPTTAFVAGDDLVFAASTVDSCNREGTKSAQTATSVEKDSCDALPAAPTGVVYNYTDAGGNSAPPLGDLADAVTLDWTASAAADTASYTVYGSDDGGGSWTSIATGITTITNNSVPTTAFVTGDDLVFSAATVDSCNREGAKSAQTATSVEKDSCDALPAAPTGVVYDYTDAGGNSAPPLGDSAANTVTLDWTASAAPDVASYTVYGSDDSGGTWYELASGITTVQDNAVTTVNGAFISGEDLVFSASTVDSCNREGAKSAQTATSVVKDSCDALPSAPTGVVYNYTDLGGNGSPPLGDRSDAVTLDWSASAAIDTASYTVYASDDGGGSWTQVATGVTTIAGNSVPTTAFTAGDDLVFSASTVDACNIEGAKSAQTATSVAKDICDAAPGTPGSFGYNYTDNNGNSPPKDTNVANKVLLDWTSPGDFDLVGYRLERDTNKAGTFATAFPDQVVVGYTEAAGDTIAGNYYKYRVKAYDLCGRESAYAGPTGEILRDTCDAKPGDTTLLGGNPLAPVIDFPVAGQNTHYIDFVEYALPADTDLVSITVERFGPDAHMDGGTASLGTIDTATLDDAANCTGTGPGGFGPEVADCIIAAGTVRMTAPGVTTNWEYTVIDTGLPVVIPYAGSPIDGWNFSIRAVDYCGLSGVEDDNMPWGSFIPLEPCC